MKIALVTTRPETSVGIGHYTRSLLEHLRALAEIDAYGPDADAGVEIAGIALRAARDLRPRAYERVLYQLGNARAHAFMVPMIRAMGGTVALHDWVLFDLATAAWPALERGGVAGHLAALRQGGVGALRVYAAGRRAGRALSDDRFALPLNRAVVRRADAFVVHSRWMRDRILAERNVPTPIGVVPHGAERAWRAEDRGAARARLALPESWRAGFLLASFGTVQEHKRVETLLRALALARRERPDARLVLAGALACETLDVAALVRELALEDAVRCTGWVSDGEADDWLHAADLCVNLRGPSTGGSSGGMFRALALGRGVIVSDLAEQSELPDDCTRKIRPGPEEARDLARAIVDLAGDARARAALEAGARRFVETECDWPLVARRYLEMLEAFPAHSARRKSLIAAAIEASDRRRAASGA